jgi:hypothetical protein
MKKMMNLAVLAIMMVTCACMVGCSESYGDEDRIAPVPTTTPKDTTPDPEPDNTWRWSTIVDQTVNFDVLTEVVEANNIAQLSKQSGETKLDSAQLKYNFGVELTAPTRLVVMSPDTTVYAGKGLQKSSYGEYARTGNDSLRTVTTTVEGGFRTNYYTVGLTTNRTEGYSLHAGKWLAYKNVTETSVMSSIWHEELKQVEVNDSTFNREVVHNVLTITVKSERQTWTIKREKVVIVDHFIRMKEGEKEEKHNHPDWWGEPIKIIGQGTYVYKPGVGPEGQGQFYKNINVLFENVLVCMVTKTHVRDSHNPMDFDYTDANVYALGSNLRGGKLTKENVSDLNSAIWRDGKWEPACCTYDHSNYCWTYMSPDQYEQGMTEHLAETCGLKNFAGKHTARLHPSLFYKGKMSNGTLTIRDDNGVAFMSFH